MYLTFATKGYSLRLTPFQPRESSCNGVVYSIFFHLAPSEVELLHGASAAAAAGSRGFAPAASWTEAAHAQWD